MSTTHRSNDKRKQEIERHQSRLRHIQNYIFSHQLSGVLNNQKWHALFSNLGNHGIPFTLTLLPDAEIKSCDFIRELEDISILVDDSGQFIAFLEIQKLNMSSSETMISFLSEKGIHYVLENDTIEVDAYR